MKKLFLLGAAALACTAAAGENVLINGGFEDPAGKSPIPGWYFNPKRLPHPVLDKEVKKSGNVSMMLGNTTTVYYVYQVVAKNDMSIFMNGFTITGYMKYENLVKGGKISSQLPFLKLEFSLGKVRLRYPGVVVHRTDTGSKDWFKFEVNYSASDVANMFKDIPEAKRPTSCALAMYCTRQPGKVWLDDVQLILHKKKLLDLTLNTSEVSASQLDFKFRADEGKKVEFVIADSTGKAVRTAQSTGTGKAQNFSVSLENLPAGEYTLRGRVEGDKTDSATARFNRIEDAFAE